MRERLAQKRVREEDIQGLKYFRKLWPLFERLHNVGCGRDKAGNRQLHMDQYCALVLLFLFNPCVRSLRALFGARAELSHDFAEGPEIVDHRLVDEHIAVGQEQNTFLAASLFGPTVGQRCERTSQRTRPSLTRFRLAK